MKMNRVLILFLASLAILNSCGDLDVEPETLTTAEVAFDDPAQLESFLARLYAGLAVTGQQGAAGNPDIQGINEGFSQYIRGYWKLQELPTDEAVTAWGDVGIADLNEHAWTSINPFSNAFYARIFFQVGLANEFIRVSENVTTEELGEITQFRAEARFLRALSYWHGLDLFRNIPFFTEEDAIGSSPPRQVTPREVFDYVESELLAIEEDLFDPRQAPYGRADKAAAWTLLAKLYLNAPVYLGAGETRYDEVITFTNRVIQSGVYSLHDAYNELFLVDNNTLAEVIFPVVFEGNATRSFGGMTFLTHMPVGGTMDPQEFGINGGWAGMRTISTFVDLFPDDEGIIDSRSGLLWTDGQTREIEAISDFRQGIGVVKYRNVDSEGNPGVNPEHPDTDFPMFRLADVYLMYAEAVLRGGAGGSMTEAVDFINEIRGRAYGDNSGNITSGELTLDFILDERSRELYWECHRRTDLIRFGQFSSEGIWPWKGGVAAGVTTPAFRDIFPIPDPEMAANPNLKQNEGYTGGN